MAPIKVVSWGQTSIYFPIGDHVNDMKYIVHASKNQDDRKIKPLTTTRSSRHVTSQCAIKDRRFVEAGRNVAIRFKILLQGKFNRTMLTFAVLAQTNDLGVMERDHVVAYIMKLLPSCHQILQFCFRENQH